MCAPSCNAIDEPAARVRLTRAVLALALRAPLRASKIAPAILSNSTSIGGQGEIDSGHPGPRPSGAPAGVQNRSRDFVELMLRLAERVRLTRAILALALRAPLRASKIAPAILSNSCFDWRRG